MEYFELDGRDRCIVSVEIAHGAGEGLAALEGEIRARLRDEIFVRPELRLVKPGDLRQEGRKPVRIFARRRGAGEG